ncbi:MAG: lamin tail domain-containing protein [Candidatus Aminicenantia bacterium]
MVKRQFINKIKLYLKRASFLAITLCVIANFILVNVAFAKKIEIDDKDVERIKTGLDLMKAWVNFTISGDRLKTILNTTISIGEVSTDITYGVLVLSALNEIELIDLVVSQRYKTEATNYFNSVLDERLSLLNYYTGTGYDILRIASGNITGPISALTLNTFSITNEAIRIFIAFENIKKMKLYNGLWFYFDLRRNNESHEIAWSDAREVVGWTIKPTPYFPRKLDISNEFQLERQFQALWDKWGPYVTSDGISEEAKQQVKNELQGTLVAAVETYQFVEEEPQLSLLEKVKLSWENLVEKIGKLRYLVDAFRNLIGRAKNWVGNTLASLRAIFSRIGLGMVTQVQRGEKPEEQVPEEELEKVEKEITALEEEIKEVGPLEGEQGAKPKLTSEEIQEILDDISERADVISQKIGALIGVNGVIKEEVEEEIGGPEEIVPEEVVAEEMVGEELGERIGQGEVGQEVGQKLCEKIPGSYPTRNKIIINEIAWMGTTNSANDEWIELKNISAAEINLTGWQLLDKDGQIKIIFNSGDPVSANSIPSNGFFLLERTNDNSVPGISADLIYTGALSNANEALYLFDDNCQLQDEVLANPNWLAGDNSSKRTMERKINLEWQTSSNVGGTPKRENSSGYYTYYGGGGGSWTPPSSPPPSPPPPLKILISEIQIEGQINVKEDFVELYNPNDEDVDLTNWYIQRKTKGASGFLTYAKKDLFSGKTIKAHDYFLIANASSTFLAEVTTTYPLTEDNTLYLKNFEREIVDKVGWGQAQDFETAPTENPLPGESIGRKWSTTTASYIDTDNNYEDFEVQTPTPKAKNKPKVEPENQLPTASFTYTPQNPIVGDEIFFSAASSTDPDGQIASFIWNFGDDNSTTTDQATTTYSFATSSDFIITLWVVDSLSATSSPATTTISVSKKEVPTLSIVINEIAWMGTKANSADEWIELYNNTTSTIDITDWRLISSDGGPDITFSTSTAVTTTISAHGFYLIERTDDNTTSELADWMGSFGNGLKNNPNCEVLSLYDQGKNLIDQTVCLENGDWPAGKASPDYISMERIDSNAPEINPQNWASNNLITRNGLDIEGNKINGTPKSENSVSKSETAIPLPSVLPFNEFDELTFTYFGSPYIIGNTLYVLEGKTLKVEPGVTIKFVPKWGTEIRGSLEAIGEEGKEIIFTSTDDKYWSGIRFEKDEPEAQISSHLEHIKIEKARICLDIICTGTTMLRVNQSAISFKNSILESDDSSKIAIFLNNSSSTLENITFSKFNTSVHIRGGSVKVKDCSFFENSSGIYMDYSAVPEIKRNTFKNNSTPIYFSAAYPLFEGNLVENNTFNGILVGPGFLSTTTWQADLPYIMENGAVGPGATLTLEPGTIVKFNGGRMIIYGKLIAKGSSSQPIVFTSFKDDNYGGDTNNDGASTQATSSDWHNIYFHSSGSLLDNVIVRYGGRKGMPWWINVGAITLGKDVEIEIKNSIIERNVFAVSFPMGIGCEKIKAAIDEFKADNTVFQDNEYLTHPGCP